MTAITMIATMCVYIYQEDPYDVADYAIGLLCGTFVGLVWPLVLVCTVVVGICLGILHLLRHLNIIRRW